MIIRANSVGVMLNMLTRIVDSSLDYWLGRLISSDFSGTSQLKDDGAEIILEHYNSLSNLIGRAAALLDTQRKAAELALLITPVVQAKGDLFNWLPVVRHAAVAIYDPVFDDLVLTADLWRAVADCYRLTGDLSRSKHAYRMASEIVSGVMTEAGIDLYYELMKEQAVVSTWQFRFTEAEAITEELLASAYVARDTLTLARGFALAAYARLQQHRFEDAFVSAQQAYVLWHHLNHVSGQARALHYMGEATRLTDRVDRAAMYLDMAESHVEQFGEPDWQATLKLSIGTLALEQGLYEKALDNITQAQKHFRENYDNRNILNCVQSLGVLKYRVGKYEEAETLLLAAADGWSKLAVSWKLAEVYYTLGRAYADWGKLYRARVMFEEANRMARASDVVGDSNLLREIDEALASL